MLTRSHWRWALGCLIVGFITAVAAGRVAVPARAWDVFRAFVVFGGGAGVIAAVGTWLVGRGASTAGRIVAGFVSLAGTTMATGGVLLALNKYADDSAGVTHQANLVKKTTGTAGPSCSNCTIHYVSVRSWLDDGKLIELNVSRGDAWSTLQPGDVIPVTLHEGRLGWPWVEPYRPE